MTQNNEVIAENRFRTVASPGVWSSRIDARRQYTLLVVVVNITELVTFEKQQLLQQVT